MRQIAFGELSAYVTGGSDGNGGGHGPVVVLMHGFGAPGTDLVPLAEELEVDSEVRFVFPMAPLALEGGAGAHGPRAWWMIDMAALQVAVLTRRYDLLADQHPPGLDEARQAVESLLDAVEGTLAPRFPPFLGGFSQGAMLATDTVLRTERAFSGLIVLSGTLICGREWPALAARRAGLPVFQSHGSADPILPVANAERLRETLTTAKLSVEYHAFPGGHGIPPRVLEALSDFFTGHAEKRA